MPFEGTRMKIIFKKLAKKLDDKFLLTKRAKKAVDSIETNIKK